MAQTEYQRMFEELASKNAILEQKRAELEVQVDDISKEIDGLTEMLRHLAPLAGYNMPEDLTGLGITEAARSVLSPKDRRSVNEVKTMLEQGGVDLSKYSAPDATIRTVLTRLVEAGKATLEKEGWKVFYKYQSTDDEVPF